MSGDIADDQADWMVVKKNSQDSVIGESIRIYDTVLKSEFIESELNSRNCFDFDYTPQRSERLILNIKSNSEVAQICFDYIENDKASGWMRLEVFDNTKLTTLHKGILK